MSHDLKYYQSIQSLLNQQIDFVSVLVTAMQGSAPQETGAKMLVTAGDNDSPYQGTVGGGKLELFAIKKAKKMLGNEAAEATESITLNLQTDIGMTCGGVVQLFFEMHQHTTWDIAVFGAGHVAQALIPLLLTLDCQVHCIDSRTEWLDKLPDHLKLNKIQDHDLSQVLNHLPKNSYIVSITQGHCEDIKIIEQIVKDRKPPYIGVIGSDSKAAILKKELIGLGVDKETVKNIYCPIGLPLGKDTPAEIAISICAQLLQVRGRV